MNEQELAEYLQDKARDICEHVDCVQILASTYDPTGTTSHFQGVGNFFARQGLAHSFITRDKAEDAAIQIAQRLND